MERKPCSFNIICVLTTGLFINVDPTFLNGILLLYQYDSDGKKARFSSDSVHTMVND